MVLRTSAWQKNRPPNNDKTAMPMQPSQPQTSPLVLEAILRPENSYYMHDPDTCARVGRVTSVPLR